MMPPTMGGPMMPGAGGPMMMGGGPVMMRGNPTMQRSGGSYHHNGARMGAPSTAGLPGERRGDWNLDGVLHERWRVDGVTGKITKVEENQYSPDDPALKARMEKSGVEMFPNRVPVGGTPPTKRESEHQPEE